VEESAEHFEGVQEVVALIVMARLWRLAHVLHSTVELVGEAEELEHDAKPALHGRIAY
jgi:hypothetical protein